MSLRAKRGNHKSSIQRPPTTDHIGFVFKERLWGSIHPYSFLIKHLRLLLPLTKLALFVQPVPAGVDQIGFVLRNCRTIPAPVASSHASPRIGFALHNPQSRHRLGAPLRAIGFVLPQPAACTIHHNSFPALHLSLPVAPGKLALFVQPPTAFWLRFARQALQIGFVSHDSSPPRRGGHRE
jgi:hypothetical protein